MTDSLDRPRPIGVMVTRNALTVQSSDRNRDGSRNKIYNPVGGNNVGNR